MKLTPQAEKLWLKIPTEIRVKLLNNVWCSSCLGSTGIAEITGKVEGGDLILHGICTKCGKPVTRVIESN